MLSRCPAAVEWEVFLKGTLPLAEAARLDEHLTGCAACRAQLSAMAGGHESLFQAKQSTPIGSIESSQLREAMDQLAAAHAATPIASPGTPARHGTRLSSLGDYEILDELGRGGMGVVYRARQASLGREVAVKVILSGQLASPADVRRFHVEAEAVAKLDHPHIVPVFEIGEDEGHHFFSMKLVEGGSLADRLSENPICEAKEAARLVAVIARAVHYAHQRGVLHRDLKPGNILLDRDGRPHVTDFGLAKLTGHDSNLTRSAAVMGSPNYMAPELATGHANEATTAVDVYSLGSILYELIAGRPPFQAESAARTIRLVIETDPVPPVIHNKAVPPDLATICLKCLEKDPGRRYASAELLAEELDRFCRGEPILARPVGWSGRSWRWCRRQPALAASLFALGLVFLLGFLGVLWKWSGEVQQRRFAQQESHRAQQAVTRLEIERAEALLEAGDSARGLAYLARLLRQQPANRVVAERLMSALTYRSFCLPIAPLRHGRALESMTAEKMKCFAFHFPGSVVTAEFSPDGARIVTASEDGTARLWNAFNGEPLGEPMQHGAEVLSARFSGDGQRVVTAAVDGSAKIWMAHTGQPAGPPLRHDDIVRFAGFSPDGQKVITACRDKTVRTWDAQTGQPAGPPLMHPKAAYFACFSPDGSRILTADESDKARLWDAATGAAIASSLHFHFPQFPAPFPQFSPSEKQVATVSYYYSYLLDPDSNFKTVGRVEQDNFLTATVYSPDNWRFATVSEDTTARIWEGSTGKANVLPLRHDGAVMSAHFSQDGQRIVTGSRDKSARLWDVRTGRAMAEPMRHEHAVLTARIGAGGQRVVTIAESDTAWLWDVRVVQPLTVLRWFLPPVAVYAKFSPDGRRLVVVDQASAVGVWDAQSGLTQTKEMKHAGDGMTYSAQFSPDGRLLVTTSEVRKAQLFDAATGEPFGRPMIHEGEVRQARFSPDGTRLATASDDGTAGVWEVATCKQLLELKHDGAARSVEFSPDGTLIVTASLDATARVWDAATGQQQGKPLQHDDEVYRAVFDRAGQRVATASKDKTVRIWSVQTGQMLTPPLVHADALNAHDSVMFSPDGSMLVTAAGNSAQVWDAAAGRAATAPLRHGGLIRSVRFSPDGAKILTASEDGMARLWDPETGHPVSEPMRHGSGVTSAEFSPDGSRVVTCSPDKALRIWEVSRAPLPAPDWLPALAEAVAGQRIDGHDVSEVLSVESLYALRQRLASNTESDYYGRWARWFFADSVTRTTSLSSDVTVAEYVTRRVGDRTRESIAEAARVSCTNALAFALQARILAGTKPPVAAGTLEDADWLSRYAAILAPGDPQVLSIRNAVDGKVRASSASTGSPREP